MAKEAQYQAQLIDLGVYHAAFDPLIHELCILERELSRTMKLWKATAPDKRTAPDPTDPLYKVIAEQRKEIRNYRDSLGLSPKGFQRMRLGSSSSGSEAAPVAGTANPGFSAVMDEIRRQAHDKA